ncbi:MAG: recombination protein O N-terminal domain-containing protein [Patescibacteria group bacterium]
MISLLILNSKSTNLSYQHYHTSGLILSSRDVGEADRLYDIFTERFGRITALAKSVRQLKSKLRYQLRDWQLVKLSLVRGKNVWRIVYTESRAGATLGQERERVLGRWLKLLDRLVVDEGRRPSVWREVWQAYFFLQTESLAPAALADYELLASLRLLEALGYCEVPRSCAIFGVGTPWLATPLDQVSPHRDSITAVVEEALYHSHL